MTKFFFAFHPRFIQKIQRKETKTRRQIESKVSLTSNKIDVPYQFVYIYFLSQCKAIISSFGAEDVTYIHGLFHKNIQKSVFAKVLQKPITVYYEAVKVNRES